MFFFLLCCKFCFNKLTEILCFTGVENSNSTNLQNLLSYTFDLLYEQNLYIYIYTHILNKICFDLILDPILQPQIRYI